MASTGLAAGAPRAAVRTDIQALRALAVTMVVAYHAWPGALPGGYLGVDVFFVVSGYLVGGALVHEAMATGRVDLRAFAARRVKRLVPAAVVVIGATVVASAWIASPLTLLWNGDGRASLPGDALAALTGTTNVWLMVQQRDYLDDGWSSPFTHFWSLGVEWQFYIVAPLLALCVAWWARGAANSTRRRQAAVVAVGLASLAVAAALVWSPPSGAFFHPGLRFAELWAGVVIAQWWPVGRARQHGVSRVAARVSAAAVVVILGVAALGTSAAQWPSASAALAVVAAAAILAAAPACAGRAWRPVARLGDASYTVYLVHWPALVLAADAVGRRLGAVEAGAVVLGVALVSVAIYQGVEHPLRGLGVRTARAQWRVLGASLGAGALVVGAAAVVAAHARTTLSVSDEPVAPYVAAPLADRTTPLPRVVAVNLTPSLVDAATDLPASTADGCDQVVADDSLLDEACVYGPASAEITVVLWGDSQAQQWLGGLTSAAGVPLRVVSVTASGCPPAEGIAVPPRMDWCDRWRDWVHVQIERADADVVLASGRLDYDDIGTAAEYAEGVATELGALPGDLPVIWLAQAPHFESNPVDCLVEHPWDTSPCAGDPAVVLSPDGEDLVRAAVESHGGAWVDLNTYMCRETCEPILDDVLVMRDENHVTSTFAGRLAPVLHGIVVTAVNDGAASG